MTMPRVTKTAEWRRRPLRFSCAAYRVWNSPTNYNREVAIHFVLYCYHQKNFLFDDSSGGPTPSGPPELDCTFTHTHTHTRRHNSWTSKITGIQCTKQDMEQMQQKFWFRSPCLCPSAGGPQRRYHWRHRNPWFLYIPANFKPHGRSTSFHHFPWHASLKIDEFGPFFCSMRLVMGIDQWSSMLHGVYVT